jgi:hypothetical protein
MGKEDEDLFKYDVLKDEIQLYLLGVFDEAELLETINIKRRTYGFADLQDIPEQLTLILDIAEKGMNIGIEVLGQQLDLMGGGTK